MIRQAIPRGAIIHARTSTTTAPPPQLRVIGLNLKAEILNPPPAISNLDKSPSWLAVQADLTTGTLNTK